MLRLSNRMGSSPRRGSLLAFMAVLLVAMSGLAVAVLCVTKASGSLQWRDREHAHARYVAQAGLSTAVSRLQSGHSGALGSAAAPVGWDRSRYYVTQDKLTSTIFRLTATGLDDRVAARQELVVRRLPSTDWRFGAFGKEFVHMSSNAKLDSFDSDIGGYALQATNGTGSSRHAGSSGDIGSNGDITLEQNAKIWGNANPGPGHGATILGNAVVTGSTEAAPKPVVLPAIVVPSYKSYGALTVSTTTRIPTGDRTYTSLTVGSNKTLNITGPANIVITNLEVRAGGRINIDATNGDVQLWVIDNFVLGANSLVAPTDFKSKHLRLNLLSDNVINPELNVQLDTVTFSSNSQFYGTILAPNAAIVLRSNFNLYGSLLARSVDLSSNAFFHFDEALLSASGSGGAVFETISWREVPYADR